MSAIRWVVFVLLPVALGCGSKVTVTGRVLFKNEPLPGGQVTFRPVDPKVNPVTVPIDEAGNYEAKLPAGEVAVSVDNRSLEPRTAVVRKAPAGLSAEAKKALGNSQPEATPAPAASNAPSAPAGKYVRIPTKYFRDDTSGLGFKVEPGMAKHDINLE